MLYVQISIVEWRDFQTNDVKASELYNIIIDPEEATNIADIPGNASIAKELKQILDEGWRSALPVEDIK